MLRTPQPSSGTSPFVSDQCAFLNISAGGTGFRAAAYIREFHQADNRPYPMRLGQIDTDPITADYIDLNIPIGLDEVKIDAIRSNPNKYGPHVPTILEQFDEFLHPEDICNGSRTVRALTQLAFLYHRSNVLKALRRLILDLKHEGGFNHIVPVIFGSSGGGAGSALLILLALAFLEPSVQSTLTEGFPPGTLHTPIAFVVEPFAYAEKHQTIHADKILANAFAFRIESAAIERRKAYKYICHLGLANQFGTVLDQPDEIARVLGTSIYQFERHWADTIKPRYVDTVDVHVINGRYQGDDFFRKDKAGPEGNGKQKIKYAPPIDD